jgi:hypothetical protein
LEILYKDNSISITDQDITIRTYYFPSGQSKVIAWRDIKSISVQPLTLTNGKYRMWGMGLRPYWFNSDWRANKRFMFVINTGHFIKAAMTPDDFEAAKKAIETKISLS